MGQRQRRRWERPAGVAAIAGALTFAIPAPGAQAAGLVGARAASKTYTSGPAAIGVALERSQNAAKLVFELNVPVLAQAYVLADPDRVIVEIPETAFLINPTAGRAQGRGKPEGLVASYRFGQFAPGRSRVVIDLAAPAKIVKAASEPTESGAASRLVIELAATDADSFRAAARAARAAQQLAAPVAPPPAPAPRAEIPVVVIDPGHGGVDIGATAGKDTAEKEVVLDFARRVAGAIDKGGKARSALTRNSDVFIPLGDRVKIARDARASLLVSIHADTLNEPYVHGATVYTLSDRASDAEAARVAAKENAADRAGGLAEPEETVDVNDILFDLTRRETRALSHVLAQRIAAFWKSAGDLNKNPLRSAGFVVLKAPDVPSVLLELGYLSSDKDVAKLTSPEWREQAAQQVARAIENYFAAKPTGAIESAAVERRADAAVLNK